MDSVHSQCNGCFLQVVCVSREVDHEWHVVKTQNGICDFNCPLAMIFSKIIGTWMVLYGRHVEDTAFDAIVL